MYVTGDETVVGRHESVVPMSAEHHPAVVDDTDEEGTQVHRHYHQTNTIKSRTIINITVKQKQDGTEEEVEQSIEVIPEEVVPLETSCYDVHPLQV